MDLLKTKAEYYARKLQDSNPTNRENAAKAVYDMYSDTYHALPSDKETEGFIAKKKLIDDTLLHVLLEALKGDKSEEVRRQVALALGASERKEAIAPLAAALQDEDSQVAGYAASGLGKLGGVEEMLPHFLNLVKREGLDDNMKSGVAQGLYDLFNSKANEGEEPYYIKEKDREPLVNFLLKTVGESGMGAMSAAMALKDAAYYIKTLKPLRELEAKAESPEVKRALSEAISALEERIAIRGGQGFQSGKSPSELEGGEQGGRAVPRKRAVR